MVTPTRAEVLRLAIPLRLNFRHALAERHVGDSVVVRLEGDDGTVGYGECAPRDYVSGETAASVEQVLERLLPHVIGRELASLAAAAAALDVMVRPLARAEHAAFCALELALLDLVGRSLGVSAGDVLGPVVTPRVVYSGVVSADEPKVVRVLCERMRAMQLHSVKVKVGRSADEDLATLRTVREVLGDVALRVDANCAWTPGEAIARLRAWAPLRLAACEQPVAADDLAGMAAVTAASPVPIVADEALVSVADAERLAAAHACHAFNIRISKSGGMLSALRIHAVAERNGIACMLGAQVGETALLSAAGRHFASRVRDVRPCEGSFGTMLLEQDVGREEISFGIGGVASILTGPGLGVDVVESRLREYAHSLA